MKKLVISLIACLSMVQSSYAALSPVNESLSEYQAIISALGTDPNFQNIVPQNDSIIDIKRLTKKVNVLGKVKYGILTYSPESSGHVIYQPRHKKHCDTIKYIATLNITPNPGIGPKIITVVSIVPDSDHH